MKIRALQALTSPAALRAGTSVCVLALLVAGGVSLSSARSATLPEGKAPAGWKIVDGTAGADGWAKKVTDPKTEITFILVPPGTFTMGATADETQRYCKFPFPEQPPHEVHITKPFYLGETEVTQSQWFKVMGNNPSKFVHEGSEQHPVEKVHWQNVKDFCERCGYRMPTEAEWEYACRAGTTTPFYTGDSISNKDANFNCNFTCPGNASAKKTPTIGHPTPVGTYPPNPWGFRDMMGNVWELVADTFDPEFYRTSPKDDPVHTSGKSIVMRGGGWPVNAFSCRSATRLGIDPLDDVDLVGARVAKSLP